MIKEDPLIRRLSKKFFPYLWMRHKLIACLPFPESSTPKFSIAHPLDIGNVILLYSQALRPSLLPYMRKHLNPSVHSKIKFWHHVSFLCIQLTLVNDNIFDFFFASCAITSEVALFCYSKGFDGVLSYATMFIVAFFEVELAKPFYSFGGWENLNRYMTEIFSVETYCQISFALERGYLEDFYPFRTVMNNESLLAQRREKLLSARNSKTGTAERETNTKRLAAKILQWDFDEYLKITAVQFPVFKRNPNIRHRRHKSTELSPSQNRLHSNSSHLENMTDLNLMLATFESFRCFPENNHTNFRQKLPSPQLCQVCRNQVQENNFNLNNGNTFIDESVGDSYKTCCSDLSLSNSSINEAAWHQAPVNVINGNKETAAVSKKNYATSQNPKEPICTVDSNLYLSDVFEEVSDSNDFSTSVLHTSLDINNFFQPNISGDKDGEELHQRLIRGNVVNEDTQQFLEFKKSLGELGFHCFSVDSSDNNEKNVLNVQYCKMLQMCKTYLSNFARNKKCLVIIPKILTITNNQNEYINVENNSSSTNKFETIGLSALESNADLSSHKLALKTRINPISDQAAFKTQINELSDVFKMNRTFYDHHTINETTFDSLAERQPEEQDALDRKGNPSKSNLGINTNEGVNLVKNQLSNKVTNVDETRKSKDRIQIYKQNNFFNVTMTHSSADRRIKIEKTVHSTDFQNYEVSTTESDQNDTKNCDHHFDSNITCDLKSDFYLNSIEEQNNRKEFMQEKRIVVKDRIEKIEKHLRNRGMQNPAVFKV